MSSQTERREGVSTVFRWSIWGDKRRFAEMLPASVGTFRRAFGSDARYVIATDEPSEIQGMLGSSVEVVPHGPPGESPFNLEVVATWKKWCPSPRAAPGCTEFYVDSDIFLVGDPTELRRFAAGGSAKRFMVMQEAKGAPYFIGGFGRRVFQGIPPVNTGLLGQRPDADLTQELKAELRWWLENVPDDQKHYHDDQGAVVAILSRWYLLGQVELLPQDRYCIVNRRRTPDLKTLAGIEAIHTTMGHHAFHQFRREIEAFAAGTTLADAAAQPRG